MKLALVHELLTMRGGAERVLRILAEMFPEAPIYTLLYDERKLGSWFPKERVRTSRLQRFAGLSTNHHLYLPWFPRTVENWDFSEFDVVLSTSSAFIHGIITNGKPRHLSYVHSPARYLWDRTHDILEEASEGFFGPLRSSILSSVFHRLRTWDSEAADRPDRLLAASAAVQRRIELYWRRESTVIHPPIEDHWFAETSDERPVTRSYYLIVSTLSSYKRIPLAIEACNRLHVPLLIAGEGRARASLQKLAGPTVRFLGYQTEEQLRTLYRGAKALLFPGEEDFGLVPLESMACGTPVIAYRGGGALETIIEGETGEFFDDATPESLKEALEKLERKIYSPVTCAGRARQFSPERFRRAIEEQLEMLMK